MHHLESLAKREEKTRFSRPFITGFKLSWLLVIRMSIPRQNEFDHKITDTLSTPLPRTFIRINKQPRLNRRRQKLIPLNLP